MLNKPTDQPQVRSPEISTISGIRSMLFVALTSFVILSFCNYKITGEEGILPHKAKMSKFWKGKSNLSHKLIDEDRERELTIQEKARAEKTMAKAKKIINHFCIRDRSDQMDILKAVDRGYSRFDSKSIIYMYRDIWKIRLKSESEDKSTDEDEDEDEDEYAKSRYRDVILSSPPCQTFDI
jgi:hypothetical protein